MDWITNNIAIGNYLEAQDVELLRRENITAILSLDKTFQGKNVASMGLNAVEVVPLDDGPGNDVRLFHRAIDELIRLSRRQEMILVQCHAGRSRSAIVMAGYLMKTLAIESDEALAQMAAKREIAITPGIERLLESVI